MSNPLKVNFFPLKANSKAEQKIEIALEIQTQQETKAKQTTEKEKLTREGQALAYYK